MESRETQAYSQWELTLRCTEHFMRVFRFMVRALARVSLAVRRHRRLPFGWRKQIQMKPYSVWVYVVWICMWFVFYAVRISERHFGAWSEITFCLALPGPTVWITIIQLARNKWANRNQKMEH